MRIALFFGTVYLFILADKTISYLEVNKAVKKLSLFIYTYENEGDYSKPLEDLLSYYPVIKRYTTVAELKYEFPNYVIKDNADKIFLDLLMVKDEKLIDIKYMFNPIAVFKTVLLFPSRILRASTRRSQKSNHTVGDLILGLIGWAIVAVASHLLELAFDEYLLPYIHSSCRNSLK